MSRATLLCILLIVCVTHAVAGGGIEFVYNGFAGVQLQLDGAATITQDGILSLTVRSSGITGHAFDTMLLPFVSSSEGYGFVYPSFSTTFVFSTTPDKHIRSGDGMAFVISPTSYSNDGKPGAYLGLDPGTPFLAIELDTVYDPEVLDIDDNHVGIDINNLMSIHSVSAGYFYDDVENMFRPNYESLRLSSGNPMQIWVDYNGLSMQLNVTLAPVPNLKPSQPLLSSTVNLSNLLSYEYDLYAGFSASTVDRVAVHQILGWSFNMGGPAPPLNYSLLPLERGQRRRQIIKWLSITVSSLVMVGGLLTACFLLRCWRKRRAERQQEDWRKRRAATNGFSTTQLLGQGGFGRVYGGVLAASGLRIAVKRISSESAQGLAQFTAEVLILGRLRANTLAWSQRLRIIKGVASGLFYLHEDWEQVIIHRDVKASNVLLDDEMNGRLGDFGLARMHDHGVDAHTTHVAGTRGYLAPELPRFGKATKATDVFAFGAFVLEVACGRRPVGLNARGELLVLVEWVRQVWASSGCVADAMDPRLEDYTVEEAELVLKLGLLCSHPLPAARPGMRLVMQYLDGDLPLPEISPDYLAITDVDQVFEMPPSVAASATSLSGGR